SFSFLRLGDGEIQCLLAVQKGALPPRYHYEDDKPASIERAYSASGIEVHHVPRLQAALERCTFLDYCDGIPFNREHIAAIGINRKPSLPRNRSPEPSNIIFAWTELEFRGYVSRHRCLIASAEAALLRELLTDPGYRRAADACWPDKADTF